MDAAVARAEFDEVWAVLQAMQEQDEVLDDLIHQMQAERRLTGSKTSEVSEDFGSLRPKGFNDNAAARTSRGSRPHADARQAASSHRHPLPGPPRPPVGRDAAIARPLQETAPPPASSQRRSGLGAPCCRQMDLSNLSPLFASARLVAHSGLRNSITSDIIHSVGVTGHFHETTNE